MEQCTPTLSRLPSTFSPRLTRKDSPIRVSEKLWPMLLDSPRSIETPNVDIHLGDIQ